MNLDLFKFLLSKIKHEAPQITDCTISGFGEPFTDIDVVSKIEYAIQEGYKVHVVTNGSLLDDQIVEHLFDLEISSLRFSVHAIDLCTYLNITHATVNQKFRAYLAIDYAILKRGLKNQKSKDKTKLIITADIISENESEIEPLKNYFKEKVDILEIWRPHNWADWGDYRKGKIARSTCGRPFQGPVQIGVTGNIILCCFDYNERMILGNFKNQSLKEIFNSELYKEILHNHLLGTIQQSNLLCKNCDQLYDENKNILIYNNKFNKKDRINRTSTTYTKLI
jgi:hypothetical protein